MKKKVIEIEVVEVKGTCEFGHKVGDKIILDGETVQGKICYESLMMLLTKAYALLNGATFDWAPDGIYHSGCPDPYNQVIYRYKVVEKEV